jgi:hypothetical protein
MKITERIEAITEALKKPFLKGEEKPSTLSTQDNPNIEQNLGDLTNIVSLSFVDNSPMSIFSLQQRAQAGLLKKQNDYILQYRKTAEVPEVSNAIDEIVNEATFVVNNSDVVYVDFKEDVELSDKLKDSVTKEFNSIKSLMNLDYNIDSLFKKFYIDGQLIINAVYDNAKMTKGIQGLNILSPINFHFDSDDKKWKYSQEGFQNNQTQEEKDLFEFKEEEVIRVDSGLYSDGIILSHLQTAIKTSNQLSTLEDLLIPLRFSRSVSRRVFNIDVGDLPHNKAMQALKEIQDKFKYKKYYDVEKGQISNSSSVASIVEDYYFPNRGGTKGTTVDVLDESGNLGETGDLDYFKKKLYISLKVPLGRLEGSDKGNTFDYAGTQIENDEIAFFAFINRLRQRFNILFIELLRRQLLSKKLIKPSEWDLIKSYITIKWEKENNFLERQNIELLKSKVDLYNSIKDLIGDVYPKRWVLKNVFKLSDEEIDEFKKEMQEEAMAKEPDVEPEDTGDIEDTDVTSDADSDVDSNTDSSEVEPTDSEEPEEAEEVNPDFDKNIGTK